MENFVWIWIAVIVISLVTEIFTEQLVSIWFVPAAFVTAILSLCKLGIIWQVLIFVILSVAGIVLSRIFLAGKRSNADTRTNTEALIGERCVVTEKIDNFAECGQVRIRGQYWTARGCNENDVFEVGEALTVTAIEGVKLICKKLEK